MVGEKQFRTVMDTLLDDEVYYSLYSFIERCNNFCNEYHSIEQNLFNPENNTNTNISLEVANTLGCSYMILNNTRRGAILTMNTGVSTPVNSLCAANMSIQCNARATDISPYSTEQPSYEFGWYLSSHSLGDDEEAELFQESTLHPVYEPSELQEMMNRARNLPIPQNKCLTIDKEFMYHRCYSILDRLLKGY